MCSLARGRIVRTGAVKASLRCLVWRLKQSISTESLSLAISKIYRLRWRIFWIITSPCFFLAEICVIFFFLRTGFMFSTVSPSLFFNVKADHFLLLPYSRQYSPFFFNYPHLNWWLWNFAEVYLTTQLKIFYSLNYSLLYRFWVYRVRYTIFGIYNPL